MPTLVSRILPNNICPTDFWFSAAALCFPSLLSHPAIPWQSWHGTGLAQQHLERSESSSGGSRTADTHRTAVPWPPTLLYVEQLRAHWSFSEDKRFRSSPLLLTWSLSCSGLCSTSDPESPRLQRSARPPVTSTKASDTCPAHSCSYEPWSLRLRENRFNLI